MGAEIEKVKNAIILFADLVGSSRLSDVLRPLDYDDIIKEFHHNASASLQHLDIPNNIVNCDGGVRGDEVVLIMTVENLENKDQYLENISLTAKEALKFAVDLNVRWFLSSKNQLRIQSNATPHRLGIGLHYGQVVLDEHTRGRWNLENTKWTWLPKQCMVAEGFAINFAKRVEGVSRSGNTSAIALSQSFYSICRNAGLPVFIGHALSGDTKGFEEREPIFELVGQSVLTEQSDLIGEDNDANDRNLELIKKAFARDPEKTLLILELVIDIIFRKGGNDNYEVIIQLADEAAKFITNPFMLLYRAARAYHRKGDFERAMRLFKQAAFGEPSLVWAHLDLAAGHWKRGLSTELTQTQQIEELNVALGILNDFIHRQPRHFYAYTLLALVKAHKGLVAPLLEIDKELLLTEAGDSLKNAQALNPIPMYLYLGIEGIIKDAKKDSIGAKESFQQAIKNLNDVRDGEHIPPEHFYQTGFAVPGFEPPRASELIKTWERLMANS